LEQPLSTLAVEIVSALIEYLDSKRGLWDPAFKITSQKQICVQAGGLGKRWLCNNWAICRAKCPSDIGRSISAIQAG